jgi:endonuclease/exonuclease/phosphatase family metal-dependent hydrolase
MCKANLLVVLPLVLATACETPTESPGSYDGTLRTALANGANDVSVMTQNLYHGADIAQIANVPASQVPFAVAEAWATIQATDFPTRARALAAEIAATRPHLIGLQEVTTWRTQTPSDFVLGQQAPNATTVAYDFLAILLDALADRGLDYRVAALSPTSDIEVPAYTGVGAIPYMDIRFGDAEAVLARSDVKVQESFAYQYSARSPGALGRINGWAAARVIVGRRELTFVSTHLIGEENPDIQAQQAAEVLAWIGEQAVPVILVGDFNSAANPGAPDDNKSGTYAMLLGAGFTDVWARGNKAEAGLTCCHDYLLANEEVMFDQRLDLVLLNQGLSRMVGAAQARVIGDDPAVHAAYGLWPSNHAGVFAVLHMPMGLNSR